MNALDAVEKIQTGERLISALTRASDNLSAYDYSYEKRVLYEHIAELTAESDELKAKLSEVTL